MDQEARFIYLHVIITFDPPVNVDPNQRRSSYFIEIDTHRVNQKRVCCAGKVRADMWV